MVKKREKDTMWDKKVAAIYCRVSTYEHARGEFSSLDAQERALSEYFKMWVPECG